MSTARQTGIANVAVAGAMAALLIGSGQGDDAPVRGRPISSINAVIGDLGIDDAWRGHDMTAGALNESTRIAMHLAFVERLLRARDVAGLPAPLAENRRRNLDRLAEYRRAGRFPTGDEPTGRLPTFVDDRGRRCAVAYLVEASAGAAIVESINRRFRNAYIEQIDDPRFREWTAQSGLTIRELATIQPAYHGSREAADESEHLAGIYRYAFGSSKADGASLGGIAGEARWLGLVPDNDLVLTLDGELAWGASEFFYYRAVARAGVTQPSWRAERVFGLSIGAGVEGLRGAYSPALIVPAQLFWEIPGPFWRFRARAEVAPALVGRLEGGNWSADVDVIRHRGDRHTSVQGFDLVVTTTLRRASGVWFAGLAVGVGISERSFEGYGHNRLE